jgi:spore coat protein A
MKPVRTFLFNRREFLCGSGALTATYLASSLMAQTALKGRRPLDVHSLAQFVDPLPIPDVLRSDELRVNPSDPKMRVPYYRLHMKESATQLHQDLRPTRFWGFNSAWPGPTIEAHSGQPAMVEWINELPATHFLPIDHNLEGAEKDKPEVRAVVHLHGGRVPPESDGFPETWFVPGKSSTCFYPNDQDPATLWYHDHAMGINRLNIYAGLFGLYIVRDSVEDGLGLPANGYEVPLVMCDRQLDQDGQLLYPVSPKPGSPWIPEAFGDVIVVNGKISPYLEVEPRAYRLRLLNAANGRFFHLVFDNQMEFQQIGSDQGLLSAPVTLKRLTMAPGERADLIVDFSKGRGQNLILKSENLNVMQFRVAGSASVAAGPIPASLRPVTRMTEHDAVKTRELLLEETDDGADNPLYMLLDRKRWKDPVTEKPELDTTEVWSLVNATDDSHPIHLHLVRFQVLDRTPFFVGQYQRTRKLQLTGAPVPPDPNEMGWKDTVRAEPGMVTRIIVRFEGYTGRYVWHCHILEHGDNEMMRPYEIVRSTKTHGA